jgi:hypothetical protein
LFNRYLMDRRRGYSGGKFGAAGPARQLSPEELEAVS